MNFTNILSLALFLTLCLLASRLVAWLIWNLAYKRLYKRVSFKKQKVDENLQSLCRSFEKFKGKRVDSIKVVFEDEKQKLSNVAQEIISNRQKQGVSH